MLVGQTVGSIISTSLPEPLTEPRSSTGSLSALVPQVRSCVLHIAKIDRTLT